MRSYIPTYPDPNITPEEARRRLPQDKVVVGWYSNRRVRQSVTHYHPYHEYIYMVSGKAHYYADGGLSQNEDGYWQTPDAVSGATIAEGCTYLDMLKTLYDRIQSGDYVELN